MKAGIIILALVAAGAFAGVASAQGTPAVSSNWSGYVATPPDGSAATFSDVTGTWIEPDVTCTPGRNDAVAFWVGLGGAGEASPALEQLGTGAQCDGGTSPAAHYAWWEIVPAASVRIPVQVKPGDKITAAVLVNGQRVTLSLKNLTTHKRFSKVITLTQTLDVTSAEWIAEAPSNCFGTRCRTVPLTNFGAVTFTNAAAIANGHPGTILDPAWLQTPVELIAGSDSTGRFLENDDILGSGVGAVPGDVSTDGRSFAVVWHQDLQPPSSPS